MENSIHELIAALHQTSRQPQQQSQPLQNPRFELAPLNTTTTSGQVNEDETDEDDNITRPTNAGTDESEERKSLFPRVGCCAGNGSWETDGRIAGAGGDY